MTDGWHNQFPGLAVQDHYFLCLQATTRNVSLNEMILTENKVCLFLGILVEKMVGTMGEGDGEMTLCFFQIHFLGTRRSIFGGKLGSTIEIWKETIGPHKATQSVTQKAPTMAKTINARASYWVSQVTYKLL